MQQSVLKKSIDWLRKIASMIPDKRKGKNSRYNMSDIVLGAFSVFFTQSPSFLEHQRMLEDVVANNNACTLFGVSNIPTDNHIRSILDPVQPDHFFPMFHKNFLNLKEEGVVENKFRPLEGNLLLPLDGTQYHSSQKIHCKNCSKKCSKDGSVIFSHNVLVAAFVAPETSCVIPLAPEFISPQDGHKKQDCEIMAAKRWVEKNASYAAEGVTILGDDLYSRMPYCLKLLEFGFNFLLIAKPSSHKYLFEWIEGLRKIDGLTVKEVVHKKGKKRVKHRYTYVNKVPLCGEKDALEVNWCQIEIIQPDGKISYTNSFVTNHTITHKNVDLVVKCARSRWKIENETINNLKTKGYNIEHNYGHGKEFLAQVLLALNLIAFALHNTADMLDKMYQLVREKIGTRKTFFEHIRSITVYHVFLSWNHLFQIMIEARTKGPPLKKLSIQG